MNWIGISQGGYYLVTAVWPFLSLRTFIAVTGPKTDLWLVKTVAALLSAVGIALIVASIGKQGEAGTVCLGVLCALALTLIDIYYVVANVIRKIYLADAIVELIFIALWIPWLGVSSSR